MIDGEHLLLGAIYQATTDELWVGGRDLPATLNGEPLPALEDRALAEVAISTYLHPARVGDLPLRDGLLRSIAGAASVRIIGSGSVELAAVAAGRLGVWLHADTPTWDWFPAPHWSPPPAGWSTCSTTAVTAGTSPGPPTGVAQARAAVLGTD